MYCVVLIEMIILMCFLRVECQTRWVSDTHLKLNGYGFGYKGLPMGMSMGLEFYPHALYCQRGGGGICSTRPQTQPISILTGNMPFIVHST
jgi:hypothetical protein